MKDRELKKINFFERERSVNEKKSVRERMKFLYTLNACEFSRSPFFRATCKSRAITKCNNIVTPQTYIIHAHL